MLRVPVLESDVVRLEPLDLRHVPGLVAAAGEDRTTYAFTSVPDGDAATRCYVEAALADREVGEAVPFAVVVPADGRVVGTTRYLDIGCWWSEVPSVVEIGHTWLAASVQRTAVNTAAKLLLLGHAFDTWAVRRVSLKTDARNDRSRAAIARLGARFEGIRRAHVLAPDAAVRDSAYFSIVAEEWPEVRAGLEARLRPSPSGRS